MSIESEVSNWKYSNFLINKKHKFSKSDILSILPKNEIDAEISQIYDKVSPFSLNKIANRKESI